jgi:hypothetical protein
MLTVCACVVCLFDDGGAGKAWKQELEWNPKTFEDVYIMNAEADPISIERHTHTAHSSKWKSLTNDSRPRSGSTDVASAAAASAAAPASAAPAAVSQQADPDQTTVAAATIAARDQELLNTAVSCVLVPALLHFTLLHFTSS